ncbi:SGNH/GDSL hydrolase family protein [Paenibacillus sp. IB182496]|uniref:SGNH/GDSL hydrolase family protein n=1 Tax=Paenibacillus sabuli TaxID=2772509 RepID=A0A927BR91_9BACL|nr:SGNH/GDSL hydrolase family protein [Paenibacillus sabuli]MBD2844084.1 SGNH/GDSL hydrolase family protein [Paenibacillus sabuli]
MKTLFVIGDSISIQYGPALRAMVEGSYVYDRKGARGPEDTDLDRPAQMNGGDSARVLEYVCERDAEGFWKPGMVLLLNCGLHDIKTDPATGKVQVEIADYQRNLRAVFELMQRRGVEGVWVRTTPVEDARHNDRPGMAFHRFNRDTIAYNETADALVAEFGWYSIDLYGFSERLIAWLGADEVYVDHVHFSERVHGLQAAYLCGALAKL